MASLDTGRERHEWDDAPDVTFRGTAALRDLAERDTGLQHPGPAVGVPERAEHRAVGCWLPLTGDDLHLDPAPAAGEGRRDLEKICIEFQGNQTEEIGQRGAPSCRQLLSASRAVQAWRSSSGSS
jgi:hypothetical protein